MYWLALILNTFQPNHAILFGIRNIFKHILLTYQSRIQNKNDSVETLWASKTKTVHKKKQKNKKEKNFPFKCSWLQIKQGKRHLTFYMWTYIKQTVKNLCPQISSGYETAYTSRESVNATNRKIKNNLGLFSEVRPNLEMKVKLIRGKISINDQSFSFNYS